MITCADCGNQFLATYTGAARCAACLLPMVAAHQEREREMARKARAFKAAAEFFAKTPAEKVTLPCKLI